jgi:CopG-like RHH_1 or ribbon-helix-helix domain, RHH_5
MTERKAVQLPAPVYGRLAALAEREHRSIASQALHLLQPAIVRCEQELGTGPAETPEEN